MILSIIIPAYNASRTILRCLNSLIDNSCFGNYEILIINDGSTDDSGGIIRKWAEQQVIPIRYIETRNEGVSAARNRGINEAVGDWIFFCDADDYIANGSIHTLINLLDGADKTLKLVKISMRHVPDHFVSDADSCIWGGET